MENLKLFQHAVGDPFEFARQWKRDYNRHIVGYFCSYTPEEIILAAGALGFRIFGAGSKIARADAHLQVYSCSLIRGALEDGLSGKLDFLDGVVFPHTCDSIQRLSDIWRINIPLTLHADVVLPVKLDTESAREYIAAVFKKFRRDLEKGLDVEISDDDLRKAADTCNRIRQCLKKMYGLRSEHPDLISSKDLHVLVKGAMMMDRGVVLDNLLQVTQTLEQKRASVRSDRKRLVLSGGICNMPDVYEVIENAGGAVVWDDLCTGSRSVDGDIDMSGDIMASVASRYVDRVVCPAKHSGLRSRGEHLVNMVRTHHADGVVFFLLKFCDPHAFDYPYMKEMLEKEGIPSMLFEVEDQFPARGQVRTRVEAFLEMI